MKGLLHLQKMGVSHRDLSLENVLINHNMSKAVIIDLGMCLRVPFGADNGSIVDVTKGTLRRLMLPQGQCGKPNCMPPEILLNDKPLMVLPLMFGPVESFCQCQVASLCICFCGWRRKRSPVLQVRSSGFCRGFFFEVLPHSFLHPDEPSLSRTPLDTSCSLWALHR